MSTTTPAVRSDMQKALDVISSKLKAIKTVTESPFKTNGDFKYSTAPNATIVKIHSLKDIRILLSILGYLTAKEQEYQNAARLCNLSTIPAFEWMGYGYDSWKHDLQVRSTIISQHNEVEKLKLAKSKLEAFMTEEDRLAATLKELQDSNLLS